MSDCDALRESTIECTCADGVCSPAWACKRQNYANAYQRWFQMKYGFEFLTFPRARAVAYQGAVNNLHDTRVALDGVTAMTYEKMMNCKPMNRGLIHQLGYNPKPILPFGKNISMESIDNIMPIFTDRFAYPTVMFFILIVVVSLILSLSARMYMRNKQRSDPSEPTETYSPSRTLGIPS